MRRHYLLLLFATFFDLITRRRRLERRNAAKELRVASLAMQKSTAMFVCRFSFSVVVCFVKQARLPAAPLLLLSLSPRPFLLSFHLSAGKCHLTLFFLPHDFSGFVFPFICITNYAGSRCSTFPPLQSFFSPFIYWQLQASGGRRFLSPLSLCFSISSCCKHRLTIQLFFIFLFCLLQSSTAAATVPHPSGWGSVAVATTTVTKKINLHAASSTRPRWQHCIKHTNTLTQTYAREREQKSTIIVCLLQWVGSPTLSLFCSLRRSNCSQKYEWLWTVWAQLGKYFKILSTIKRVNNFLWFSSIIVHLPYSLSLCLHILFC